VRSKNDKHNKQNNLQQLEQLVEGNHFESTLLMVLVDAAEKRIQVHDVIPLGYKVSSKSNKESSENK
jgi:hypothetical protein